MNHFFFQIKFLGGTRVGETGTLVNIDGPDGVIKVDGGIDLLQMSLLAKYIAPAR